MAETGTLVDLLLFYTLERALFNRLVCLMGKCSQEVKRTIALWLTLEEIGYHDMIRKIHSYDNKTIEALFNETLHCLACINPDAIEPTKDNLVFQGLFDEPVNFRFFYYNREFMHERYMHILETVCNKIFGETAAIEVDESGMKPMVRHIAQGSIAQLGAASSTKGASCEPGLALGRHCNEAPGEKNILNPKASEFHPGQSPEGARTLFLTFSKGHPLTREEIANFFISNWGDVVKDVYIEQTRSGQDPQFGRIVFTTAAVIPRVLNGQSRAKFLVNRKHLWARIYVNRHKRTSTYFC